MVEISNIEDMITHRVGFGTLIIKDGETKATRIRNLTDIVDEDFNLQTFTLPTEKEVKDRIYKPTVGGDQASGLVHILLTLNAGGNVNTALKRETAPLYSGVIKDLKEGGAGTQNYREFDLFFDKPKANDRIQDKSRSISLYLPTVGGKGNIDTSLSKFTDSLTNAQKKNLNERFKELAKITPLKFDGNKKAHVRSTPMVHYYQSRYIASMLLEQAKQAVATKSEDLRPISRITGTEEELISKAIDLSPDVRTEVDQIFDMHPIGTTVRFRNKDTVASGGIDLMNEGPHIDIGILQRQYGLYNTQKRKQFKELVAEIIRSLPVEEKHSKGINRKYYSIDSRILESVLVWINDTEFNPPAAQKNLKMVEGLSSDTEELTFVTVAPGSVLEMPGWMIFEYSKDRGESLMRLFSMDFEGEWESRHQMYALALSNLPDDTDELEQSMFDMQEFASAMITGTLVEVTAEEITLDLDLSYIDSVEPESKRVRMDRKRLFSNELTNKEKEIVKAKFLGDKTLPTTVGLKSTRATFPNKGDDEYMDGVPVDPIAPWEKVQDTYLDPYGVPYAFDMGFEEIAPGTEGVEVAYPRIYELNEGRVETDYGLSRAFHALGDILMYLVGRNAQKVATSYQSESIFDRSVAGLLGTYEKPGPASYHAQLHHEMLKDMTRDAFKQAEGEKGLVSLGASLIFEQYSNNPSKLMVMWMLANFKLIDMGGMDEKGQPSFFTLPKTEFTKKGDEADLMNTMAVIIISYYRLAFYPLRLRGKTGKKGTQYTPKNWAKLQKDANTDPPEPYAFAAVLRFLSQAKGNLSVEIPAWMPGLPEDFAGLDRKRSKQEVSEYISWAYGSNPTSKEHFCEIAAAYHAAKALSYYEPGRYAEMMQAFVEAVEAERGEGFLMSVLIAYNEEERLPGQTKQMKSVSEDIPIIETIEGKI